MRLSTLLLVFASTLPWSSHAIPLQRTAAISVKAEERRGKLEINNVNKRGSVTGSIGLGDNSDLLYTVPIEVGSTVTAVHLDTGSSDLWIVSDQCTSDTCVNPSLNKVPSSGQNMSGSSVTMKYGDSTTGTQASGPVAFNTATVAGIAMDKQAFAAINDTTNPTIKYGAAGIFGLGFPSGSVIQKTLVKDAGGSADDLVAGSYTSGPLLSRISATGELQDPMFTIQLQRETIDFSGSGQLTIGKLPDGVDNSSLTWVPVRLYSANDGGINPPSFAPNEVYPFRWEIDIDGVFLDGEQLPASTLPTTDGVDAKRVSALIDTGNSIIRGPQDVVNGLYKTLSPTFDTSNDGTVPIIPCDVPKTLAFQIGGKMFPVDPRDFISELKAGDSTNCVADNVVSTDPPGKGRLFRWSLGDPFMKSTLVAFHYGNLTHPSADPPRIGFMSTVPTNANSSLQQAVDDAQKNGGNFDSSIAIAPTAQAAADAQVTISATTLQIPVAGATQAATNNNNNGEKSQSSAASRLTLTTASQSLGVSYYIIAFVIALCTTLVGHVL